MLFVRGASPIRKDSQENNSPRRANEHETFENAPDYEERLNINRHRENENKRGTGRGGGTMTASFITNISDLHLVIFVIISY